MASTSAVNASGKRAKILDSSSTGKSFLAAGTCGDDGVQQHTKDAESAGSEGRVSFSIGGYSKWTLSIETLRSRRGIYELSDPDNCISDY